MQKINYLPLAIAILGFNTLSMSQSWEPFGDVGYNDIRCLFVDSTDNSLYIGGHFRLFDSLDAKGIVRWDGQTFQTLGDFPSIACNPFNCDPVLSIIRYKDEIYCNILVGSGGPGVIRGLARWDGDTWDSISVAVDGAVFRQEIYNDELYIMGRFDLEGISPDTVRSIFKWDGEDWGPVSFPYDEYITIVGSTIFNGELYVTGNFWNAEETVRDVAKYDGTTWSGVGEPIQGGWDDVADIIAYKNELYICGDFKKSAGNAANKIMKLKDDHWVDVGGSFKYGQGAAGDMLEYKGKLYVFGNFDNEVGGIQVDNIAVWDGERWCGFDNDFNKGISDAAIYNDTLIIGGGWEYIDSVEIKGIARWTGGDYLANCGEPISGIQEGEGDTFFEVSPNPARATLQLSATLPAFSAGTVTLQSLTPLGVLIHQEHIPASGGTLEREIDVSAWPPGLYLLRLEAAGQAWVQKVVVQR